MKVNEHLSILFIKETAKLSNDGLVPIYTRITIEGSRAHFSTGIKIIPELWNQETEQVVITSKNKDQTICNNMLNQIRSRLTTQYFVLDNEYEYVTAEMVKLAYQGKLYKTEESGKNSQKTEKTLCQVLNYKFSILASQAKKGLRAPATLTKWKTCKRKIRDFLHKKTQKWDIPLNEMKFSLAQDFVNFLTLQQDLSENSAFKYLKNVKELLKIAESRDWISKNPFSGAEAPYVNPERRYLSMREILAINNKQGLGERLDDVRNIFLFACFTGYAFKELADLEREMIYKGDDGQRWIKIDRQKTGNPETLPLLPIPAKIVDSYKNDRYCIKTNKILPVNSNQKYNAYLKELANLCELNIELTSHVARHTFATTICLDNDVPIETVSKLLGHKSIKTTMIYAKISKKKLTNNMRELQGKLFTKAGKLKFKMAFEKLESKDIPKFKTRKTA